LFVNLNGELRVEMLDDDGKVIASSALVSGDQTKQKVELPPLSSVAGKPVRFRFHLSSGSLYAFWVTEDQNGASHGYLGAGGPGYLSTRDTP
jgi:hypothetical protein